MARPSYKELMEKSPVVLTLTINNSQPIRLSSFVKAFTSLAREYEQAVRASSDYSVDDADIFI